MHAIRGFKTFFVAVAAFSSALLLFYVFDTDYIQNSNIYDISLLVNGSQEEETSETLLLEILALVHNTPNLWGFRKEDDHETRKTETRTSRIMQQREWVSNIAKTKFIQRSKTKKILVYTDRDDNVFHDTENKVQCPYAPTFASKCELVIIYKEMPDQLKNQYEPFEYKYMMEVDAVARVRNGYWDIDDVVTEPQPAFGIPSIIYTRESPCHTGSARYGELGAWAANYWRGADIPTGNRGVVWINGSENSYENHYDKLSPLSDAPSEKKHLVAALISNCFFIKNNRLGYIRELMKYMDIHVYGKCGNKTCPQSKERDGSDDCINHIQKNYKFYLAFENCNCRDYITEKFFSTALRNGLVPVALGAPRSDYEEVAPPNSFIHVDDFQSPKELALYLLKLDKNVDEYNKYLDWRAQGNWAISHDGGFDMFCRMCGLIYYADFRPPTPWPHRTTRFRDVTQCAASGQWNWNATRV